MYSYAHPSKSVQLNPKTHASNATSYKHRNGCLFVTTIAYLVYVCKYLHTLSSNLVVVILFLTGVSLKRMSFLLTVAVANKQKITKKNRNL